MAEVLDRAERVVVLRNRQVAGSCVTLEQVAVAPGGVWVIATESRAGRVELRRPLFGKPTLTIAGRDRSALVEALDRQVCAVRAALEELAPGTALHGALCVTGANLPLLGTVTFRGYPVLHRKALTRRLNADGPVGVAEARGLADRLAERFPPA